VLTVLLDGWALAYELSSPAAVHVQEIMHALQPEARLILALPAEPPFPLPGEVEQILWPTANTGRGRLAWEQGILDRLGRRTGASLLHLVGSSRPLIGALPAVLSPAGWGVGAWMDVAHAPGKKAYATRLANREHPAGIVLRLRRALFQGGLPHTRVCWPADLLPVAGLNTLSLPPVIHPFLSSSGDGLSGGEETELPETFILYHGPDTLPGLRRVVETWRWAADTIGESHPLLLTGLSQSGKQIFAQLAAQAGIRRETFHVLDDLPFNELASCYHRCSAFFYPLSPSPWGDPLRMALACGGPVVAVEDPWSDALVGPSAYLVSASGQEHEICRSLAGALITVVVEEQLAQELVSAARLQAAAWRIEDYRRKMLGVYQQVTSGS
jgi:hypothetical protein